MPASYKLKIASPSERTQIKGRALGWETASWTEKPEQYCDYRLDGKLGGNWIRIKQFTNGTLYLEASDNASLQALGEKILPNTKMSLPDAPNGSASGGAPATSGNTTERGKLDLSGEYIGTDESGKGDYFGPLVIAGVLVDDRTCPMLVEMGVMDSKKLNDATIQKLSMEILAIVGNERVGVVEIGPEKYNDLYAKFKASGKNLNHLLAWGHAKVIENLLAQNPSCTQAVADQFGNEHFIKNQLQERGKGIILMQTPKAEANVGVAAASIIARNRFVQKMKRLSQQHGIHLPFGAGPNVLKAGKQFLAENPSETATEALKHIAKLHFKTTEDLLNK